MFEIIRPDSLEVLKDEKAIRSLSRYFAVVEDKLPNKYSILKKIRVDIDSTDSTDELWKVHLEKLELFKEVQKEIDSGKITLEELETPRTSLLDLKIELSNRMLRSCKLCERQCGVDRKKGETGFCKTGFKIGRASCRERV